MAEDQKPNRIVTEEYFRDLRDRTFAVAVWLEEKHKISRWMNIENISRIAKAMTRKDV